MGVVQPQIASSEQPLREPVGVASVEFVKLVPAEFARRHLILSEGTMVQNELSFELIATVPHVLESALFNVGVLLGRGLDVRFTDPESLATRIDRTYAGSTSENSLPLGMTLAEHRELNEVLGSAIAESERDLLSTEGKADAVRLVDLMLFEALTHRASDMHIQPTRETTLVRFRVDGALRTCRRLPASAASAVVSRIKVMAGLDIAEKRMPQDGRATVTIGATRGTTGRRVDLRVSTLPSTFGERVVLRLLDPARSPHVENFTALGMPPDVEVKYLSQINRASGLVLSTGPTGSGKTTTLYATLSWLSRHYDKGSTAGCELNMMTIEDPVEYDLAAGGVQPMAISQTQVDTKKGLTFASGLRHVLRQDPDVIMVGEIRDEETARISVQASLTGHMVLSTLHTTDAPSAVARLLDLRVEPVLLGSALNAVLAQRLVRLRHPACAGQGCELCLGSGFKGRTGLFELLVLDEQMRASVCSGTPTAVIRTAAIRSGMVSLRQAGERLVREGMTAIAEVERVVDASEEDVS